MANWVIIVGVALALVLGLAANRFWARRPDTREDEGFGTKDLVGPITSLAVLLMAFIMVEGLSSYGRARENIGAEARVLDNFSEAAGRVRDRSASRQLQANAICYARAIRFKEWERMVDGERAPEVRVWTGRVQELLTAMRLEKGDAELERLIDLDAARGGARLARMAESIPTIPTGLNWLMFGSVVVLVLGFAFFLKPKGNRFVNTGLLIVFAVLTDGTLYMINDLDRPFVGVNKLQPTELARVMEGMERDYAEQFPQAALPCDGEGVAI